MKEVKECEIVKEGNGKRRKKQGNEKENEDERVKEGKIENKINKREKE